MTSTSIVRLVIAPFLANLTPGNTNGAKQQQKNGGAKKKRRIANCSAARPRHWTSSDALVVVFTLLLLMGMPIAFAIGIAGACSSCSIPSCRRPSRSR